jgi:DNA processing protein
LNVFLGNMSADSLLYQIAISLVPGVGSVTARKLIAYAGSIEAVFSEKKSQLMKIPDIGEVLANRILHADVMVQAEKEVKFIERYKIRALYYQDPAYPDRLRNCNDSPVVLFVKGEADLNATRMIAMVGTRSATAYGKELCTRLVADLTARGYQFTVVSGLAYGIDIFSHKAALQYGQDTLAVLGHGLSSIYPAVHASTAREIVKHGALVTDFLSDVKAERNNFLRRNRIIAGLSEATIVVESATKGGALITAEIANSYNRDVLAFPGRTGDEYSTGCNMLIRQNKAALITGAADLEYFLGWEQSPEVKPRQAQLFTELEGNEKRVFDILRMQGPMLIDELSVQLDIPVSQLPAILLNLEFEGRIQALPGNVFQVN